PPTWLWNVEPRTSRVPGQAATLKLYNSLLGDRFGPPVRTTLLLLRRSADAPDLTGVYEERFPGEEPYLTFRYQVIRVWEQPPEAFLEGGLGLVPLAPVTKVTEAELPRVVQRMDERISHEAPPEEAGLLWAAAGVLMGLVWPKALTAQLLENVMILRESAWVQGLLEDGRAEGRIQGCQGMLLRM